MTDFGPAAIVGLCIGFLWGIGCSLAILYSIYLVDPEKVTFRQVEAEYRGLAGLSG